MKPSLSSRYRAYVALGGNVGDRVASLQSAVDRLRGMGRVRAVASLYETTPVGPSSACFINSVACFDTTRGPMALLRVMQALEAAYGRRRAIRWGPRTLDLDLLVVLDAQARSVAVETPELTLPHPRMLQRDFVLEPLAELAPELRVQGASVRSHLATIRPSARTVLRRFSWPTAQAPATCSAAPG